MEVRFVRGVGTGLPEPYLLAVGEERAARITARLEVLESLADDHGLLPPVFLPLGDGFDGMWQVLVDYEEEVHHMVFCRHQDSWVVLHALRREDDDIPVADKVLARTRRDGLRLQR